jgi:ketosteroid isomerase-like protein
MTEQQNLETVQRAFAALGKNDMNQLKGLLSPDVEWHTPGPKDVLPFAGVHKGPDAVVQWWKKLGEVEEALHFAPKDFIPHKDKVIVTGEGEMRVKSTGKTLAGEWVHIYTLKDGKIVDYREFYDTAQEVEGYKPN